MRLSNNAGCWNKSRSLTQSNRITLWIILSSSTSTHDTRVKKILRTSTFSSSLVLWTSSTKVLCVQNFSKNAHHFPKINITSNDYSFPFLFETAIVSAASPSLPWRRRLAFAHFAGSQDFLKCDWKRKPTKTVPRAISVQHKYIMYTKLAELSSGEIVSS